MRESDVIEWLISESTTFLSNSSLVSLSTPAGHVDVAEAGDPPVYPFIGIQKIASTSDSAGIGSGELYVDDLSYTNDGVLESITYRRDVTLRVEVIPVTDEDPKLRDDLTTDLTDFYSKKVRKDTLHSDMEGLKIEEATPQGRADDFVRADGIPIEIDYERYLVDNDPDVADTVNVDIDVGDEADTDSTTDTDTFDESFS